MMNIININELVDIQRRTILKLRENENIINLLSNMFLEFEELARYQQMRTVERSI